MKTLRFLPVILVVLLAVILSSSPVLASTTQSAHFGASAAGLCIAGIGPSSQSESEDFEVARGTFGYQGNATVTLDQSMLFYAVVPGTVKALGSIRASWSHDGQSYQFQASIYSTDLTEGWVEPTDEWVIFGGLGGPYGCPLEYRGMLTIGVTETSYSGPCGMMAVNGSAIGCEDISVVVTKFILEDIDLSINVFWAEEATSIDIGGGEIVDIPAAQTVFRNVILTGHIR